MQKSSQIVKKYAQALMELGENNIISLETFLNEISVITKSFSNTKEAKQIFDNPAISKEEKKELIKKLVGEQVNKKILNFLLLLIDKQRLKLLPEIQNELNNLINKQKGIIVAEVSSAYELDLSTVNKIVETLQRSISTTNGAKDIKIEQRIDPSLIGGVKVKINDLLYDGSIKGRLENLKRRLG